jgi:hypothetical protein
MSTKPNTGIDPAAMLIYQPLPRQPKQERCRQFLVHTDARRTFYWIREATGPICQQCVNARNTKRALEEQQAGNPGNELGVGKSGKQRRSTKAPSVQWRLHTAEYSYHLLEDRSPDSRWIVRWEYKSHRRRRNQYPRNHVHIDTVVQTPAGPMDLDKLHLPTGWVTIEEVIRFLIAEMGVPPKIDDWDDKLVESDRFFREWTRRIV